MRIRWTQPAARDLTQICDYIEQHGSTAVARRVALATHENLKILEGFHDCCRIGRKSGTRELVFTGLPYLAIYRVRNDTVEILRILHGAQNWP